jgi:hypothetical protein
MRLERESAPSVEHPSPVDLALAVHGMRSTGPSSVGLLIDGGGDYLQFAGGPQLFVLERRTADQRLFRACQDPAIAPYPDDTELHCSAGRLRLKRDEWFKSVQLIDILTAFSRGDGWPKFLIWREVDRA